MQASPTSGHNSPTSARSQRTPSTRACRRDGQDSATSRSMKIPSRAKNAASVTGWPTTQLLNALRGVLCVVDVLMRICECAECSARHKQTLKGERSNEKLKQKKSFKKHSHEILWNLPALPRNTLRPMSRTIHIQWPLPEASPTLGRTPREHDCIRDIPEPC